MQRLCLGLSSSLLALLLTWVAGLPASSLAAPGSTSQSSSNLQSQVTGAGGVPTGSTAFKQRGTLGQPTPIGTASASSRSLYAGFWAKPWSVAAVEGGPDGALINGLTQNFPNPFSANTTITYMVAKEGPVEILIFNVRGQQVRTLVREMRPAGRHAVTWDKRSGTGGRVSPGIYFYQLRIGSFKSVKKMVVLN